mgnify:CR=1 FL=1
MTDPQRHIRQWLHNRGFIATIEPRFHDWIVTATFYAALHAVDTLLAHDQNSRVVDHASRNDVLARTNRYQQIHRHYKPLYMLAQSVRYLAAPEKWIPFEKVESHVLHRYLYPIEASVQKLINQQLDLPPIKLRTA